MNSAPRKRPPTEAAYKTDHSNTKRLKSGTTIAAIAITFIQSIGSGRGVMCKNYDDRDCPKIGLWVNMRKDRPGGHDPGINPGDLRKRLLNQ